MTFDDFCKFTLETYPAMYSCPTWEDVKFCVAHRSFMVLGNGMEWHLTLGKNGYLTTSNKPKNYGKEKYTKGDDYLRYVNAPIVYYKGKSMREGELPQHRIPTLDEYMTKTFESGEGFNLDEDDYYTPNAHIITTRDGMKMNNSDYTRCNPYPNFSKLFSKVWNIDPKLIASDWKKELLEHHEYWLDYYTNDSNPKCHIATSEEYLVYWNVHELKEVQEGWLVPMWNGFNADECVEYLRIKYINDTKQFLEETIDRLKG